MYIQKLLIAIAPKPFLRLLKRISINAKRIKYSVIKRPPSQGETTKAKTRREKEHFFERFCQGRGLDIGYGGDLLAPNCCGFDIEDGDAQHLAPLKDETFNFVYSSHTLEHLSNPKLALHNWWRVLKPGGHLILYLPERNLYEKKKTLPSRWNTSHKHFFLLDRDESPDTIGVIPLIKKACPNHKVIYAKVCRDGHTITESLIHSDGEYSIEVVVQKLSSEAIIAKGTEGNKFYDHYSQDKSTKFGKWLNTCLANQIFKFAQIEEEASVLEIGPGRGGFSDICLSKGVDYWAIEPNEKMANHLEKKGVKVLRNIVPPVPEFGRNFDVVVMIAVMEHMDTMTKALELGRDIHKLLNLGGRFVICSPDYINWRHRFFYSDFSHNYVTTSKRLRGLLISAGFEKIEAKYQSGPFTGIMCLLASAMVSWLPFGYLDAIFPEKRWFHKLYKLQTTFLRGVLILGEKHSQLKERVT